MYTLSPRIQALVSLYKIDLNIGYVVATYTKTNRSIPLIFTEPYNFISALNFLDYQYLLFKERGWRRTFYLFKISGIIPIQLPVKNKVLDVYTS